MPKWITEPKIVEACRTLSIGQIKHDLMRSRNKEPDIVGHISFKHGDKKNWQKWNYWFEYADSKTYLVVGLSHYDPNRILLAETALTYGDRSYFICGDCGRRVSKLYLPQRTIVFRCRKCWRLKYEIQTINRNTQHGEHFYQTHRAIKLIHQREKMNRIFYKGRYSKRYERFLRLCNRVNGLESIVSNAKKLMSAIRTP